MKKLILLLLVILLGLTLSGCDKDKEYEVNYICELTYYGEQHSIGSIKVDNYEYSKASTWVSFRKSNGEHLLIDLTEITVLCKKAIKDE